MSPKTLTILLCKLPCFQFVYVFVAHFAALQQLPSIINTLQFLLPHNPQVARTPHGLLGVHLALELETNLREVRIFTITDRQL